MAEQLPDPQDNRFLLESKPFWKDFFEQIRDLVRPPKQPELVLESKPIPVKDIWSPPKPLWYRVGSVAVHVAVILILILLLRPVATKVEKAMNVTSIYLPPQPNQPQLPRMRHLAGGGAPALVKPTLIQTPHEQPAPLAVPTTLMPLQEVTGSPSFGAIGPISGPPGVGGGSGGGSGGTGSGEGGGDCTVNCGGGVGVTQPVAIYSPDPEYSDAARKAKFQGTCVVQVMIGADGRVSDPKVVQPLGLGLDQKAVEAVLKWRFQPARDKNGKPVAVMADIQVNFRLY